MSVEFKKNGSGKCPVAHGAMSKNSQSTTEEWWPKNLKLDIFKVGQDLPRQVLSQQIAILRYMLRNKYIVLAVLTYIIMY